MYQSKYAKTFWFNLFNFCIVFHHMYSFIPSSIRFQINHRAIAVGEHPTVLVSIVPPPCEIKRVLCFFFVYHKLLYRLKTNQCLFYSFILYRFHVYSFQNILFSSSSSSFSVCLSACHSTTAFRIRIHNLHLRLLLLHFHFDFKCSI